MPEDKLERWYWIMDEKIRKPVLRGGRLNNLEHTDFFIEDIESPDVKAEVLEVFDRHPKMPPIIEYKKIKKAGHGTAERIIVTGINNGRE